MINKKNLTAVFTKHRNCGILKKYMWEWFRSGGRRGLQTRCGAAILRRVCSTRTHSRHFLQKIK